MSMSNFWSILLFLNVHLKLSFSEPSMYQGSSIKDFELTGLRERIQKRALGEEDIFKQLESELNVENTERRQSDLEEKLESDRIFKELVDEMTTPRSLKKDKDYETIQLITDSIAKLVFRGRQNPGDVLGTLSTLFNLRQRLSGR